MIVTRAKEDAGPLALALHRMGVPVLLSPVLKTKPIVINARGRSHLKNITQFDGVLFTSARAVERFSCLWRFIHKGRGWPSQTAVYAVGPKTAKSLQEHKIPVTDTAQEFSSEGLAKKLIPLAKDKRFLFPRAKDGQTTLITALRKNKARVTLFSVYKTVSVSPSLSIRQAVRSQSVTGVVFCSPSAARAFLAPFSKSVRRTLLCWSIGPTTTGALKRLGVSRVIQSEKITMESLAACVGFECGKMTV